MRFTWCVAALVDRQLDPRRASGGRWRARSGRPRARSPSSARERLVGRLALDVGDVDLVDLVAGMGEPVRELAVVREQQHAGRVGVEPPDGDDARRVVDEADDGRAALRVARGRDHARRLVSRT